MPKPKSRPALPAKPDITDPIKAVIYDHVEPDFVLPKIPDSRARLMIVAQVGTENGTQIVPISKTADCPLNYLRFRCAAAHQISDVQFVAAVRYREDLRAMSRVGSNTGAIIQHMMSTPKLTAEDRAIIRNGEQFIKSGGYSSGKTDPSAQMLTAAFRVRRFKNKLDPLDDKLLIDLLLHELTVAKIGQRWGFTPEVASAFVRVALWRLAKISMLIDAEFCAWAADTRRDALDRGGDDPLDTSGRRGLTPPRLPA